MKYGDIGTAILEFENSFSYLGICYFRTLSSFVGKGFELWKI